MRTLVPAVAVAVVFFVILAFSLGASAELPKDGIASAERLARQPSGLTQGSTVSQLQRVVLADDELGYVKCVDEDSNPVEEVGLFQMAKPARFLARGSPLAKSDVKGLIPLPAAFRDRPVEQAAIETLFLSKAGFVAAAWDRSSLVVLKRGLTIHGVVKDLHSKPVPGAVVQVSTQRFKPLRIDSTPFDRIVSTAAPDAIFFASADSDGYFELSGLRKSEYHVAVGHDSLQPIRINAHPVGARIAAPSYVTIEMVGLTGYRLEVPGEIILSTSFMYPRGINYGYKGIQSILGRQAITNTCPGHVFEVCGLPRVATELAPLHLYALLSKSGPVLIKMEPKSCGGGGYASRYTTQVSDDLTGVLHVSVADIGGRPVDCRLKWVTASGTAVYGKAVELREGSIDPAKLSWGGRCKSGADASLVEGAYSIEPIDPFLRRIGARSRVQVSRGATVKSRLALPCTVQQLRIESLSPECFLSLDGSTEAGQKDFIRRPCRGEVESIPLPVGVYNLIVYKPQCVPQKRTVSVGSENISFSMDPWCIER